MQEHCLSIHSQKKKHNKVNDVVDLKEKGNIEIKEIPVKPLHEFKDN